MHQKIVGHVENKTNLTKKMQLISYDGAARLRPIWDEICSKYDVVVTPSVPDEAPEGLQYTGASVGRQVALSLYLSRVFS